MLIRHISDTFIISAAPHATGLLLHDGLLNNARFMVSVTYRPITRPACSELGRI
jgi:hypothetical protein